MSHIVIWQQGAQTIHSGRSCRPLLGNRRLCLAQIMEFAHSQQGQQQQGAQLCCYVLESGELLLHVHRMVLPQHVRHMAAEGVNGPLDSNEYFYAYVCRKERLTLQVGLLCVADRSNP